MSTGKYACQNVPKSLGYEKDECPACRSIRIQKENDAKAAEIRQIAINRENNKKAKEKSIEDAKKLQQETDRKNKVTEVFVVMPSSSSNSNTYETEFTKPSVSSSQAELSNPRASTSTTSEATIYNNIFLAEKARKYREEQAMNELAKGVVDLFSPSPERLQQEKAQREAAEQRARLTYEEETRLNAKKFRDVYLSKK